MHVADADPTFFQVIRRPSAFVPMLMSLSALGIVLGYLALHGVQATVSQTDEGTPAHLFQLLLAAQLPVVGWFALRWFPEAPRAALLVLVLQAAAGIVALAPVFLLGM